MLTADIVCFPNNVVNVLATRYKQYFDDIDPSGDTIVIKRPVSSMDADQTISVVPVDWGPVGEPEIGRKLNQYEPTVQGYTIMIQALINDADEDRAIARHSLFSTLVRRMLYRDQSLLTVLPQLKVTADGVTESLAKYGVRSQQFLVTNKDASFQYLSVIEFRLETQTT